MSLLGSGVGGADDLGSSLNHALGAESALCSRHPLGEIEGSTLVLFIAGVLTSCSQSEVFESVVEGVSVFVVNHMVVRNGDLKEGEDYAMDGWENLLPKELELNPKAKRSAAWPTEFDSNLSSSIVLTEPLPILNGCREVLFGPFLPEKLSSFRFVPKAGLQKGCVGQFNQMLHSCVGGYGVKRDLELRTPGLAALFS